MTEVANKSIILAGPEIEPVTESVDTLPARSISRRRFIEAGLLISGAAITNTAIAYRAEQVMQHKLDKSPAHFTWVTSYKPDVHREVMLYFPGTGDIHSVDEARTFRQMSGLRNVPIGALVMSHFHTTQDELIDRTVEALAVDPPDYISFVGRSWGGPEGLKVTATVAKELGSTLKQFSLWSAPYDINDGYQGSLGSTLDNWFPDWNVFNFDAKVIAVAAQSVRDHGYRYTVSHLHEIHEAVMSGEDWNGLRSDVHMLNNLDSHDTITDLLPQVSEPGVTSGSYTMSRRPWTDHTVKVMSAAQKYSASFAEVNIPLRILRGDFEGHAKVGPCSEVTVSWLDHMNHKAFLAAK